MSSHQAFVEALLDPARPCPAGLRAWNQSDPAARFAVYRNNLAVSLVDALADTYPVTQELVGREFFRALALALVREQPPRSRVLAFYGASLADFIERFPPAAPVPYLADVARLEWLRLRAYHAADVAALPAAAIAPLAAQRDALPRRRLVLQPGAGLLCSRYAVVSLWAAHQGIGDLAALDTDHAENAFVVRSELEVKVIRVSRGASAFIGRLLAGASFGGSAEQAAATDPRFDLAGALELLVRERAITSMPLDRKEPP